MRVFSSAVSINFFDKTCFLLDFNNVIING